MQLIDYSKRINKHAKKDEALKAKIIKDACQYFQVTENDLMGDSNIGVLSIARQVTCFLLYVDACYSHREIAALFGSPYHTYSLYACRMVMDFLKFQQTPEGTKIILFFRLYGYCTLHYSPLKKLAVRQKSIV